ncbi:hypothetical protein R3P38DRAFT_3234142 [Favolaschia claudopus]|uniref:Uncharacterized protein n=1 Tax=Favolaschia claudopus TaxID=2862362 RepID=A0AAV9ZH84_9AGAR
MHARLDITHPNSQNANVTHSAAIADYYLRPPHLLLLWRYSGAMHSLSTPLKSVNLTASTGLFPSPTRALQKSNNTNNTFSYAAFSPAVNLRGSKRLLNVAVPPPDEPFRVPRLSAAFHDTTNTSKASGISISGAPALPVYTAVSVRRRWFRAFCFVALSKLETQHLRLQNHLQFAFCAPWTTVVRALGLLADAMIGYPVMRGAAVAGIARPR